MTKLAIEDFTDVIRTMVRENSLICYIICYCTRINHGSKI
jgi:hypothetical protein